MTPVEFCNTSCNTSLDSLLVTVEKPAVTVTTQLLFHLNILLEKQMFLQFYW